MITVTNFCQRHVECIPKPRCSCCVPHNIAKYRFGVRQPSCRFSHRPVRFYISRASMEAPAAGNNQSLESSVDPDHSSSSIRSASHTKTPAHPHRARGTLISLLRRELQQWYAPIVCRRREKTPFQSGPPVPRAARTDVWKRATIYTTVSRNTTKTAWVRS